MSKPRNQISSLTCGIAELALCGSWDYLASHALTSQAFLLPTAPFPAGYDAWLHMHAVLSRWHLMVQSSSYGPMIWAPNSDFLQTLYNTAVNQLENRGPYFGCLKEGKGPY